jgi:hypothetical protein
MKRKDSPKKRQATGIYQGLRVLSGWREDDDSIAEWFQIKLTYDGTKDTSLREIAPAAFAPDQPDILSSGKRPAPNFTVRYRGHLSRPEIEDLLRRHLHDKKLRERVEAAVLAAERMIRRLTPLPKRERNKHTYAVPAGSISKCHPFNVTTYYARVLLLKKHYRVEILQSEGEGLLRLNPDVHKIYLPRPR